MNHKNKLLRRVGISNNKRDNQAFILRLLTHIHTGEDSRGNIEKNKAMASQQSQSLSSMII